MKEFLVGCRVAQIKAIEDVIEETAASLKETQLLTTIPGVSFHSSLLITSEGLFKKHPLILTQTSTDIDATPYI